MDHPREIDGKALSGFELSPDGSLFRLVVADAAGQPATLALPSDSLASLIMTLPRVLQNSIRLRFRDPSFRLVYPVGSWQLRAAAEDGRLILSLSTPDGFEVSFLVERESLVEIAEAAAEAEPEPTAGHGAH